MQLPFNWGQPTQTPDIFALGGGEWEITWSPDQIHPYAAQWIDWSYKYGPPWRCAPALDLWTFAFQTRPSVC